MLVVCNQADGAHIIARVSVDQKALPWVTPTPVYDPANVPVYTPVYCKIMSCPGKLTPKFKEAFLDAMEKGMSISKASVLCGLGKDCINDWKANYKFNPECPPEIRDLFDEVEFRRARFEETMLDRISEASEEPRHWTAAAWMLERTDPENWGRNRDVTIRHENNGPHVQVNQVILGDANAREASRDFLRGLTGGSTIESVGTRVGHQPEDGARPAGPEPGSTVEMDPR